MISGVKPLSVRQMIALIPGKWLAVYIDARAMLSSQRSKSLAEAMAGFLAGQVLLGALADAGHGFHRFHRVLAGGAFRRGITASV